MLRVLKPGAALLVLEFSTPTNKHLAKATTPIPLPSGPNWASLIVNDADSYQYLAESIRMHPDQDTLQGMMDNAGFARTEYFNMIGGIVALHRGFKF